MPSARRRARWRAAVGRIRRIGRERRKRWIGRVWRIRRRGPAPTGAGVRPATAVATALRDLPAQLPKFRAQLGETPLPLLAFPPLGEITTKTPEFLDDRVVAVTWLRLRASTTRRR
jgi:hypothetical protein